MEHKVRKELLEIVDVVKSSNMEADKRERVLNILKDLTYAGEELVFKTTIPISNPTATDIRSAVKSIKKLHAREILAKVEDTGFPPVYKVEHYDIGTVVPVSGTEVKLTIRFEERKQEIPEEINDVKKTLEEIFEAIGIDAGIEILPIKFS